jgi:hypothetical protein
MVDQRTRNRFEPILAEFRKAIAHHRAAGATEQRIQDILAASIRLRFSKCAILIFALGCVTSSAKPLCYHPSSPNIRRARRYIDLVAGLVKNAIAILVLVALVLGHRWIWLIAFFSAGAVSLFAAFASIIYLQILATIGFFFLCLTCWVFMVAISRS